MDSEYVVFFVFGVVGSVSELFEVVVRWLGIGRRRLVSENR